MNKKLIFLDIDGTLTAPGSNEPPASALEAIRLAQQAGHKVFLCSGRNYDMLRPLLGFGFDGAVASGGGYVFMGERVLFDCPMTKEQFDTGMKLLGQTGVFRTIEGVDATWGDEELGDFLFAVINAARLYGINPDTALNRACDKFRRRFTYLEEQTLRKGRSLHDMTLAEMDAIWDEGKARGL